MHQRHVLDEAVDVECREVRMCISLEEELVEELGVFFFELLELVRGEELSGHERRPWSAGTYHRRRCRRNGTA